MKKIVLLISLMSFLPCFFSNMASNCYASSKWCGWSEDNVVDILDCKEDFINKKAADLYCWMAKIGINIEFVATHGTSPFIDPEGKSYLTEVVLFSEDISEAKNGDVYHKLTITVSGDENGVLTEEVMIWRAIDENKDWIDELLKFTESQIIKDIQLEERTWHYD